jgi:diacylglycerol kinase (ATP)
VRIARQYFWNLSSVSMKVGILSNPLSRRNLKRLRAVGAFLDRQEGVSHEELESFASIKDVLATFAKSGVELLVVNAGDGTVSAVLTEIYEHGVFATAPVLAVLPGGTSNMIAGDVGLRGDQVKSLRRLLTVVERGDVDRHVETRRLIRVHYHPDRHAVVGMFFGTAAICDGIGLRRRMFPQKWVPDPVAGALTLATVLGGVTVRRGRVGGVLAGHTIAIELDGAPVPASPYSIVMATTLRRIILGGSPFWGGGERGLEFTSIASPAKGLVRHAYRILYGRDKSALPRATYQSASVDRIALKMGCPFDLDGEFFQPPADTTVMLTATAAARFVRC